MKTVDRPEFDMLPSNQAERSEQLAVDVLRVISASLGAGASLESFYRSLTANVADLVGSGYLKGLLNEIAKCDLVCSNCHILRTIKQEQAGIIKPGRPRTVA